LERAKREEKVFGGMIKLADEGENREV